VKWGSVNRLVSSSGFTADALALVEFYGIQAITPGQATPEFIGQVVNNLSSVWTKLAHVTPNRMQLWVQWPEGDVEVVDATDDMGIYHPDGTHICTGNDLLKTAMEHYNPLRRRGAHRPVGATTGVGFDYFQPGRDVVLMFPQPHVDPQLLAAQLAARQRIDDPVIFMPEEEAQPVTTASLSIKEARAAATIKVRVNRPYRVIHGGKVFLEGQVLTVPDDDEHSRWLTAGWVTKVKGK
jgi:hypothetical protein